MRGDCRYRYREVLEELCEELHAPGLELLILTPNSTQPTAADRGKRMLSPAAVSPAALRQLELLGALIGLCLRCKAPLPFDLAGYLWKQLLGETPSLADLARVDAYTASLIVRVRDALVDVNDSAAGSEAPRMSADVFDSIYPFSVRLVVP